jgi:hypothetical protein
MAKSPFISEDSRVWISPLCGCFQRFACGFCHRELEERTVQRKIYGVIIIVVAVITYSSGCLLCTPSIDSHKCS